MISWLSGPLTTDRRCYEGICRSGVNHREAKAINESLLVLISGSSCKIETVALRHVDQAETSLGGEALRVSFSSVLLSGATARVAGSKVV